MPTLRRRIWLLAALFASLFGAKSIPHSLHVWGHGSYHDWPEWRRMAAAYLP